MPNLTSGWLQDLRSPGHTGQQLGGEGKMVLVEFTLGQDGFTCSHTAPSEQRSLSTHVLPPVGSQGKYHDQTLPKHCMG